MSNFQLKLTPTLINLATEGSLDTSIISGHSVQRTGYIEVYNSGRKIVSVLDGTEFNDTLETWDTIPAITIVEED